MDLRSQIVEEAMSWAGTPFVHGQRLKGVGVDCCTLLAAVYEKFGNEIVEIPVYDVQWNHHRDDERYLAGLLKYCVEISAYKHEEFLPEQVTRWPQFQGFWLELWDRKPPLPGDVGLWKFGRQWSHATMVIDWPTVLNPMMDRVVTLEAAQTVGSVSAFGGRMRLLRPKILL